MSQTGRQHRALPTGTLMLVGLPLLPSGGHFSRFGIRITSSTAVGVVGADAVPPAMGTWDAALSALCVPTLRAVLVKCIKPQKCLS